MSTHLSLEHLLVAATILTAVFIATPAKAAIEIEVSDAGFPYRVGNTVIYIDPYDYYYRIGGVIYHHVYLNGAVTDEVWPDPAPPAGFYLVPERITIPKTFYAHPHDFYHPGMRSEERFRLHREGRGEKREFNSGNQREQREDVRLRSRNAGEKSESGSPNAGEKSRLQSPNNVKEKPDSKSPNASEKARIQSPESKEKTESQPPRVKEKEESTQKD